MSERDFILDYIKKEYGSDPERLWMKFPNYVVCRHRDNRKWFCLIMDVTKEKLGLEGKDRVDVMNVKLSDPYMVDILMKQKGIFRGYHSGKGNWISVLLDGSVGREELISLLGESFEATGPKKKKKE